LPLITSKSSSITYLNFYQSLEKMSFAFGHLIGAWCAGKLYQYLSKQKISHTAWFFLLLGGILPDSDFLLDWIFGYDTHRTFTHSFFFLLLIPIIIYLIFSLLKSAEKKQCALLIGLGMSTHLILDGFSTYGVPLLWPSLGYYSFLSGFNPHIPEGGMLSAGAETLRQSVKRAIFDMGLGTAWIFYLWFRKRIEF